MSPGLRPLPIDRRDFRLGAFVSYPKLSELPERFALTGRVWVKDQRDSDFCTQYAFCGASELQEDVRLVPEYTFAWAKRLSGTVDEWGCDLREAAKAQVKVGAIEEQHRPEGFTIEEKGADFLRRVENWPNDLARKALRHRKKSYFSVLGPYEAFDDIRAAIWKFRNKKQAVVSGVMWHWDEDEVDLTGVTENGSPHAILFVGWRGDYLLGVNSKGRVAHENGYFYMHKDVINYWAPLYGAFMLTDIEKDDAKYHIERGIKWDWSWLRKLLTRVRFSLGL